MFGISKQARVARLDVQAKQAVLVGLLAMPACSRMQARMKYPRPTWLRVAIALGAPGLLWQRRIARHRRPRRPRSSGVAAANHAAVRDVGQPVSVVVRQRVHSLRAGAAGAHCGCRERRRRQIRPALREWPIGVFLLQTVTPGFPVADACHTRRSAEHRRHRRCSAAAARNLAALLFQLLQPDQRQPDEVLTVSSSAKAALKRRRGLPAPACGATLGHALCGLTEHNLHNLQFRNFRVECESARWKQTIMLPRRWALGAGRWER